MQLRHSAVPSCLAGEAPCKGPAALGSEPQKASEGWKAREREGGREGGRQGVTRRCSKVIDMRSI